MSDAAAFPYQFITLRTFQRGKLLEDQAIKQLALTQLMETKRRFRLSMAAYVILDDHLHILFAVPSHHECSAIVNDLRAGFLRQWRKLHSSQEDAPFWGHGMEIRGVIEGRELRDHLDFIHYDPVRHGLVERASDYPWSSLPARIEQGYYPEDWALIGPPAGIVRVLR